MSDYQDLLKIKEKIEKSKTRLSELKGQKTSMMETLEQEFGCKTLEAAEKKVSTISSQIDTLKEDIAEKTAELQEQYPMLFEQDKINKMKIIRIKRILPQRWHFIKTRGAKDGKLVIRLWLYSSEIRIYF